MKILKKAFLPAMLICLAGPLASQTQINLNSGSWKISFQNSRNNTDPELDDSQWKSVKLPGNLKLADAWTNKDAKIVWLRFHINDNIYRTNENLALVFSKVFDHDETYFNGVMIGRSPGQGKITSNYGRNRIYLIPDSLIRPVNNVLAIKLKGNFKNTFGILEDPFIITTVSMAQSLLWKKEIYHLVFVALYLVTGIFFLLLNYQLSQLKIYKWFGIFALLFALYQFLTNEFRFLIMDAFLVYKFAENICYLMIPVVYFHFCVYFFKIEKLPKLNIAPKKAALYYGLFNAFFGVLLVVFFNPVWWDVIITWWALSIIPVILYLFYYMFRKALVNLDRDAIFISIGTVILFYFTIDFYAIQRGLWSGTTYFNEGIFIFFLSITFALIFRLIEMQLEVQERTRRLGTVENMQDRVFNYLNLFIQKPVEKIVQLATAVKEAPVASFQFDTNIALLRNEVIDLENALDDILELSRLEVINDPEFLEPVNFYDFISAVIPENKITHYIKVDREILLNTSLELVNSFVVRVIDFPAFGEFQHIDLIITSDLRGNVHFRFMLFHFNIRKTRQLREILTEMNPEKGELWVKWAIIREIIRILKGDLQIKIINRKFLSIDIHLAAELPENDKDDKSRSGFIELIESGNEAPLIESMAKPVAEQGPSKKTGKNVPKLHAKMSVGDLISWIKSRSKK